MTGTLETWVIDIVEALGYVGVGLLVALESVFPPIPSEVVLPLAGFVAANGEASFAGMVVAATAGSLLGAYVLYGIAAVVGPVRLRRLVERYGKWARVDLDDIDRSEKWFDDRAAAAVLIGRCVPLIRSLISIPAGLRRMPLLTFTLFTVIGSAIWNTGLVGAGYLLGENWDRAAGPLETTRNVVLIVIGALLAWFVWARFIRPRLRKEP
jgi:membrane protein DedA with SNARE-associated domain